MRSPCDPSLMLPPSGGGPDIRVTSPCLSNEERVYFPDEVFKTARASQTNQKSRRSDARNPAVTVDAANSFSRVNQNAHLSSGSSAVPGFYGRGCDVRCEPQRGCCCDSEGLLRCDETIDLLSPAGHETGIPNSGPGGADQAMAIPTIETEMKLTRNLGYFNPASYNTLTSQVTNIGSNYCIHLGGVPANNRSRLWGVRGPQEPPSGDPARPLVAARQPPPPPAAAGSPDRARGHSQEPQVTRSYQVAKLLAKELSTTNPVEFS
uniref:Uncharacterized protein n=1 Tax=Macrostomum lignano TaxID=282301 RepID=A0A1I8FMI4_9PLAT